MSDRCFKLGSPPFCEVSNKPQILALCFVGPFERKNKWDNFLEKKRNLKISTQKFDVCNVLICF